MSEFKSLSRTPGTRLGSLVIDRNTTTTTTSSHKPQPGGKQEPAFPHVTTDTTREHTERDRNRTAQKTQNATTIKPWIERRKNERRNEAWMNKREREENLKSDETKSLHGKSRQFRVPLLWFERMYVYSSFIRSNAVLCVVRCCCLSVIFLDASNC